MNRNGANLLVPRPGEMCTYERPILVSPRARRGGTLEFETSAPITGSRTCPPWVWPDTMRS